MSTVSTDIPEIDDQDLADDLPLASNTMRNDGPLVELQGTYRFVLRSCMEERIPDSIRASTACGSDGFFYGEPEYAHLHGIILSRSSLTQECVHATRDALIEAGFEIVSEYQLLPTPRDQV